MSPLEAAWREFLAAHPGVRAMPAEHVTKIKTVWLDGASAALVLLQSENATSLEGLQAAVGAAVEEVIFQTVTAHGPESEDLAELKANVAAAQAELERARSGRKTN